MRALLAASCEAGGWPTCFRKEVGAYAHNTAYVVVYDHNRSKTQQPPLGGVRCSVDIGFAQNGVERRPIAGRSRSTAFTGKAFRERRADYVRRVRVKIEKQKVKIG